MPGACEVGPVTKARSRPDLRRKHFFELQNGSKVFYIHISPRNGKVYLLAIWDKVMPEPGRVAGKPRSSKRDHAA